MREEGGKEDEEERERGIRKEESGVRSDEYREYISMNLHLLEICHNKSRLKPLLHPNGIA